MTRLLPPLLLLLLALPAAALEVDAPTGYVKSLSQVIEKPPFPGVDGGATTANLLRLTLAVRQGEVDAEIAGEGLALGRSPADLFPFPGEPLNTAVDLETSWHEDDPWSFRAQLDRLNLGGRHGRLDWRVGRQAVGFGNIALFSPLDVIAPFPPDALDSEVRPGVDALRLRTGFGLGGHLEGVGVFDDDAGQSSGFATAGANAATLDFLFLGGTLRERPMAGFGLAGSLGGLGLKGEIVHYEGKDVNEPGGDLHERFQVGAVEGWYRFDSGPILLIEYLYNGPGVGDPADYPAAAQSAPYAEGLAFLLGRHYLLAGPSWEMHPLVTLGALVIWNLEDGSALLRPQVQIGLTDNLAVDLSHTVNLGDSPTATPFPGVVVPRSEFGLFGDSAALLVRWYY